MENNIKAAIIVTIKNKLPLYRDGIIAEKIELIELNEVGFNLVAQKDLYKIGDKAIFIQPDYCLSDISLFENFIRPNGDETKSMLGKIEGVPKRIRAKKFNFTKEINGSDKIYSNGILLPIIEVQNYLDKVDLYDKLLPNWSNLNDLLNITKYEEPDNGKLNISKSSTFPSNVYKTDETNILNLKNKIEFPIRLIGTKKIDGSSITFGFIDNKPIICSRNISKPLTYKKQIGHRQKTFLEKLIFWKKIDLRVFKEVENNQDDFVKYAKPILDNLKDNIERNILFRGELSGGTLKGSGNKNNPERLEKPNIKIFDVNFLDGNNVFKKANHINFIATCENYDLEIAPIIFDKTFESFEELIIECKNYFNNNLIEGIVVKNFESTFSAKIMNDEYDSKK